MIIGHVTQMRGGLVDGSDLFELMRMNQGFL